MKRLLSSMVVVGLLTTTSFATDLKTEHIKQNAVINATNKLEAQNTFKNAIEALENTSEAYIELNKNNTTKAKKLLESAIKKFNTILKKPNVPRLLPISAKVTEYEYLGTLKNIKKQIKLAKIALNKKDLPVTREILDSLRSELDLHTVDIPLATYPDAIKLALKYIKEGKIQNAKTILAISMNTLVNVDHIVPIPIIRANDLVIAASKIVKKDKSETLKYLNEAKRQLKIARLLGYTSTSSVTYKILKDKINNIENKINNHKNTDSLFINLKNKLKDFKEKATHIFSR